jgi:hypothetical protein
VNDLLAACEAEATRLKAELQPWKDGGIRGCGASGIAETAWHIKGIELDIAALDRHMSRLQQMA